MGTSFIGTTDPEFNPSITVVIPLFNKAAHIERAIRSVLDQTQQPLEILVIDDGSTDSGPQLVGEVAQSNPAIVLISIANSGPGAARNVGLAKAQGDYVAFLDADDEWLPDFLMVAASALSQSERDVHAVWTGYFVSSANGMGEFSKPTLAGRHELRPDTPLTLVNELVASTSTCAVMMCTQVALDVGGFYSEKRKHLGEDKYFFIKVIFNGPVVIIDRPLAIYHKDASDLTNLESDNMLAMEPYFEDPEGLAKACPANLRDLLYRHLASLALVKVEMYAKRGRRREATMLMRRFDGSFPKYSVFYVKVRILTMVSPVMPPIRNLRRRAVGLLHR